MIASVICSVLYVNAFAGTTVGKRYARTDELGVPFGITVDGQTAEDKTVTLRERDSTKQVSLPFRRSSAFADFILQTIVPKQIDHPS